MKTSLLLLSLLLSGFAFAQPERAGLIDGFAGAWNAIGRATATTATDGFAGPCLHMRFGVDSTAAYAIVQGPNDALSRAWETGVPDETNAFVFQAKSSQPIMLNLVLRVRERGVAGPPGVRGHLRAAVAIAGADWRPYAVRFADFTGDAALGPVGDKLFRTYHPQPQFHADAPAAVDVWVDELAFGTAAISSQAALPPSRPGLAVVEEAARLAAELPAVEIPLAPREVLDLREGWVFVPWEGGALGKPQTVRIPHGWPAQRSYNAGWYLRKMRVDAPPTGPVRLHCRRVGFWSALFVDGVRAGEHAGGFTPFSFEIGHLLPPGERVLALYVQDSTAAVIGDRAVMQLGTMRPGRATARGGLFDRIELHTLPPVFAEDTAVITSVAERRLRLVCEIRNAGEASYSGRLRATVRDWRTGEAASVVIPDAAFQVAGKGRTEVVLEAPWEQPNLWSPEHPQLYTARIEVLGGATVVDTFEQRFGFREFRVVGREFHLNGVPIRLRGESNFHGHHIPVGLNREWLRTVFRAYRENFGVNAFRVHANIGHQTVFEVADEEGFLMIDQSAIWSAMGSHYRRGGAEFMANIEGEFAEWIRRDRNHPSVVIWDAENEMIRGGGKRDNLPWVLELDAFIRRWDDTRPIAHSGAGWYDPDQDMVHVHMEEHYTKLFDLWRQAPPKPFINGEYWVGGRGEFRLPSSREVASGDEFWAEEVRLYHESIIEQRAAGVSGIMPFTIRRTAFLPLFEGRPPAVPADPADPDPRPSQADNQFNPGWTKGAPAYRLRPGVAPLLRNALAPVTAFFWPRQEAAPTTGPVSRQLVVCNDRETEQTVQIVWGVVGGERHEDRVALAPAEIHRRTVNFQFPEHAADARIFVEAHSAAAEPTRDELGQRRIPVPSLAASSRRIFLTDATGATREALAALDLAAEATAQPPADPERSVWIIGSGSADRKLAAQADAIQRYLAAGGRMLCLAQPELPNWVPVRLNFWSALRGAPEAFAEAGWEDGWRDIYYSRHAPAYAPAHPVFRGLSHDLRWWHPVDGRVSDDSLARPTATGAVAPGAWRALAGGTRRENIGLAEVFVEQGVLLLCWFQVDGDAGRNPEAQRLLVNSLEYLAGKAPARLDCEVLVLGNDLARRIERLTGAQLAATERIPTAGKARTLLLAGPGADAAALAAWAERTGGMALILSAEVSATLPGFTLEQRERFTYGAARGEDHPLFWGLASCSFEDMERPAVKGAFSAWPEAARVLLRGRSAPTPLATRGDLDIGFGGPIALDAAGAAAVELRFGHGAVIATTLEPFDPDSPHAAEILGHLLTNAGVPLAAPARTAPRIRCLKTVPLQLDGQLDDWTNDIEDRNVSPFRHAEPIVLASEHTAAGEPRPDQEASAIVYLLWNEENLYLGGVLVGRGERALTVQVGEAEIRVAGGTAAVAAPPGAFAAEVQRGELRDVRSLVDARLLTFAEIDARVGNLRAVRGPVPGRTFELAIPWRRLGMQPDGTKPFAAELRDASGHRLRLPADTGRGILVFSR
ncbi:MAG: glycoside hydrolase family 2 TIM barrel-domain containing protein [Lentisphaeria bacterium]|jgi:hypothetical protein|nr:glycoside hydrolase family 2 TIM barrel-domain containing protein [Lentisphaeria bacterium]